MAKGNFGERLKREREMREVSLNEVTLATRIGPRFLEALENEDWPKLPGGAFNRGFVRSIARYLGLDEESLLGEYDLAHGQQAQPATVSASRIPSTPKWVILVATLIVLLVVAGLIAAGVYGWRRYSARQRGKPSASAVVPNKLPLAPASGSSGQRAERAPQAASVPLDLSLSTSAATRVRILADGKLLLDTELPAGETRHFSAELQFEVTAADFSSVLLELNGKTVRATGVPGASGTIVLGEKDLRPAPSGNAQP